MPDIADGSNKPSNNPRTNLSIDAKVGPPYIAAVGNNNVVIAVKNNAIGNTIR